MKFRTLICAPAFSATKERRFHIATLLTVPLILVGLAGRAQTTGDDSRQQPKQQTPPQQKLRVTLVTDKKSYAASGPFLMTLKVENLGELPVRLLFSDGQRYDFVLSEGTKPNGKVVWQWSKGKMVNMMVGSIALNPGKPLEFKETFDPKKEQITALKAGKYTLTGSLAKLLPGNPTTASAMPILAPGTKLTASTTFVVK